MGALALASIVEQIYDCYWANPDDGPGFVPPSAATKTRVTAGEFFSYWKTILRSSLIGSLVGMLPGLGVTLAALLGYNTAKRFSRTPSKFGTGTPEGILATEAANSAVVGSNLIPTLALGLPGNIAAALLIGAFMIHGIVPGPFMMVQHGELVYALFASMLMANVVHLIIGRLGIPIWSLIAYVPRSVVLPPVLALCIVGVYLPGQSLFDVGIMLIFAAIGLLMNRTGFSTVCLVIGFLLGSMFENSLRQTLLLYKNDWSSVIESPIALVFLVLAAMLLIFSLRAPKDDVETEPTER